MSDSKFSGILKRFREIREKQERGPEPVSSKENKRETDEERLGEERSGEERPTKAAKTDVTEAEPEVPELAGLEPLPQPSRTKHTAHKTDLQWPTTPELVTQTRASFASLGVSEWLCERLTQMGFEEAFAVQNTVVPAVLGQQRRLGPDPLRDVLVQSFTGSGKTLAYCVPIIEKLMMRRQPCVRALILVPTRPLLLQVLHVLEDLSAGTGLNILGLRSDRPLPKERELLLPRNEHQRPDILVATPGRLVDHLGAPGLLSHLQFLVVDEADRLVGQSFQEWVPQLNKCLVKIDRPVAIGELWARPPQRLIFSATLTKDPGKLRELGVHDPFVFVNSEHEADVLSLPPNLAERLVRVKTLGDKPLVLVTELLATHNVSGTIVFVRSNEAAARLARLIELVAKFVYSQDLKAAPCSGEMPVGERRKALNAFKAGKTGVLVCTDLIARGIDVPGVALVVNYDLPLGAREYVHRVGRTARAGASGSAWTLTCSSTERKHFHNLQNHIDRSQLGKVIQEMPEVEADEKYQQALQALEKEVMA